MELPYSQACENNKVPILSVIKQHFSAVDYVLEIGSGTGQHAQYFAEQLPHLTWQPTDRQEHLPGIKSRVAQAALTNLNLPLELDVNQPWPVSTTPAIFSANTVHIMSWEEVVCFFQAIPPILCHPGIVCLYGPFNVGGHYCSQSNARFDQWLKASSALKGIRDVEAVHELAVQAGLALIDNYTMPANNRCLVFRKQPPL